MKFSTFYFSGTGNTRWAVETFNAIISEKGHQAAMFSIDFGEKLSDERILDIIREADCIGPANPIYGGDVPPIMKGFIELITTVLVVFCAFNPELSVIFHRLPLMLNIFYNA